MRCLVAAADQSVRTDARDSLDGAGHAVVVADDGKTLLAAHAGDYFDLVVVGRLSDMVVADACRKLRDLPSTNTTYLLVAAPPADAAELDAFLAAGVDDVIDSEPTATRLRLRLAIAERRVLGRVMGKATRGELDGRLVAADRMASMGILASGISHELNNPLSFLALSLEHVQDQLGPLLRRHAPDREAELMGSLHAAVEGCDRMRVIVADLQTFARAARWERGGAVDVRDVIDASIGVAYNEIRHRARLVRSYADVKPIDASEGRIGQVFLNLLTNAAHAIPVGTASENEIRIAVRQMDENHLVVEVSDTGTGIEKENLDKIFEPFFTTKGETVGTGLGLAICQRIIHASGGTIDVESEPGVGTTFRVVLPTVSAQRRPSPPAPHPPRSISGRMLIVDDEVHVADSLRRLLLRDAPELEIVLADGGDRALSIIEHDAAWDVILCDLMMPHVTGIDLYTVVGQRWPELAPRVIFMTGGAFTERARRFIEEHQARVVTKPFSVDVLLTLVERTLAAG